MSHFDDRRNVVANIIPIAAENFGDIGNHVEFFATVSNCLLCFGAFDRGRISTVRKPNRRRSLNVASGEHLGTLFQMVGKNADAADIVSNRKLNSGFQISDGQRRIQERMIDHFGNVEVTVIH